MDVMKLLKSNIDAVAEDIRDVTLRNTRYGITAFSHTRQSLVNMQRAVEANSVTRAAVSVRVSERKRPHVRFSGVDPDIGADEFLRELSELNPSLQLNPETCRVRVPSGSARGRGRTWLRWILPHFAEAWPALGSR
ncbi:hypothetical protein HPB50_009347 [Hyalomma asiaticum]|uniref:Uncharacterized protein n=1 Tax=Hyalomma asiaticum TaxID=266040 RepID=A0ACB7T3L2_HYAAI|nr:hypothetical protein HPB50_009347 [Hyalomma asiaticum]